MSQYHGVELCGSLVACVSAAELSFAVYGVVFGIMLHHLPACYEMSSAAHVCRLQGYVRLGITVIPQERPYVYSTSLLIIMPLCLIKSLYLLHQISLSKACPFSCSNALAAINIGSGQTVLSIPYIQKSLHGSSSDDINCIYN